MRDTWPTVRLADLAAPVKGAMAGGPFGSDLVSADYVDEGVPVIRGVNLPFDRKIALDNLAFVSEAKADSLHLNCAAPGDLVFTQRGTLGQVGLLPEHPRYSRYLISQSQMKMTVDPSKASGLYLYHYFRLPSSVTYIENHALQSGVPHINLGILRKLEVILPPLPVQQRIAAILEAYDDLIANNQRRIALLESMAEEIYREWFVRMRFPGVPHGVSRVNPPADWSVVELPRVASITYGFAFAGDRFTETEVGKKVIRIRDVLAGDSKTYTDEVPDEKYIVKAGDLLIGMDGEFHMNHWIAEDAYLVQRTCRIAPKQERLRAYLAHELKAPISHYQQIIVGATVGHLGAKHLNTIKLLVPPDSMNGTLELLNNLLDQRLLLSKQCLELAKTRDALLPRLISGKLRVDALDIQFPPSMQPPSEETVQAKTIKQGLVHSGA